MSQYKEKDANEVIPHLWLGSYKAAINKNFLKEYKIKYIVTVMDNFDKSLRFENILYLSIPIVDSETRSKNMIEIFELLNDFIFRVLCKKENILVHCKRGHHRSAVIVASFLLKYLIDYRSAVIYINSLRPKALRRDTEMSKWLFKYYLYLNNITDCEPKNCKFNSALYWMC
jgi:protein-tyrosine phosphatase